MYLRLFPAVNQFEVNNGQLNTAGRLRVYLDGAGAVGMYNAQ